MSYRLLACDIDNTLVRFPNPPSPSVQGAVRAAVEAGITATLVTGRAFRRARPIAEMLQLDTPIICNHGGSIRNPSTGATVHRHALPYAIAHSVVAWAQTQGVHTLLFDGDLVYHDATTDEIVPDFQVYTYGAQSVFARDLRPVVPPETDIVLLTCRDTAHMAGVYERAGARYGEAARVLFSHPFGVDVLPTSSKSRALAWLAAHLGIAQAEVLAIGDGSNDIDMLAWAGLGVAMGDSAPAVLNAADVVAPPFDQDGFAWAVEQYLL